MEQNHIKTAQVQLSVSRMRRWILTLMILIISANVLELLTYLIDTTADMIGSLLIGALAIYANWRAARSVETNLKYYLWRILPLLALCAYPLYYLWSSETDLGLQGGLLMLRLLLGLIAPLAILIYWDLHLKQLQGRAPRQSGKGTPVPPKPQ